MHQSLQVLNRAKITRFHLLVSSAPRWLPPVWFALSDERLLTFFAGIWTNWTSVRKVKEGETTNDIFSFLTTEPNKEVAAIHTKAMPVILTKSEEIETRITAPAEDALKLQRPLSDGSLKIVAKGEKK